jgi:hypothetical protein
VRIPASVTSSRMVGCSIITPWGKCTFGGISSAFSDRSTAAFRACLAAKECPAQPGTPPSFFKVERAEAAQVHMWIGPTPIAAGCLMMDHRCANAGRQRRCPCVRRTLRVHLRPTSSCAICPKRVETDCASCLCNSQQALTSAS